MYVTDADILAAVRKNPGADSGAIGRAVGLSMEAASSRLSTLAKQHKIDRKRDPNTTKVKYLNYPKAEAEAGQKSIIRQPPPVAPGDLKVKFSTVKPRPPEPAPAPEKSSESPGIEQALAGITGMMADNILAGVQERVLGGLVENVVEQVTATIADQVAVAVDRAVSTAIANVEARIAAAFSAKAPMVQKAPDTKRPRIMVIGGTDAQNAEVEKEFGDSLDIRFVTSEQTRNPSSWKDRVNGVARVVVMTKWISHSAMDVIDKKKYVPVNGGMTDLKNRLTELYVELAK